MLLLTFKISRLFWRVVNWRSSLFLRKDIPRGLENKNQKLLLVNFVCVCVYLTRKIKLL